MKVINFLICFLAISSINAIGADWSSCGDDLDRLRRASRDASDAANNVKAAIDEYESCKSFNSFEKEYDGCRSKFSDYEYKLSTFNSEMSTVESRIKSVSYSCGSSGSISFEETQNNKPQAFKDRMCSIYKPYKGKLSPKTLMQQCVKSMSELDCKKCLE
jgi:hypothetical protein